MSLSSSRLAFYAFCLDMQNALLNLMRRNLFETSFESCAVTSEGEEFFEETVDGRLYYIYSCAFEKEVPPEIADLEFKYKNALASCRRSDKTGRLL